MLQMDNTLRRIIIVLVSTFGVYEVAECAIRPTTRTHVEAPSASSVTLGCETDRDVTIRWYFYAPLNPNPLRIYGGHKLADRFANKYSVEFDGTTGNGKFTILRAELNDAGVYACLEFDVSTFRVNFSLKVVESGGLLNEPLSKATLVTSTSHTRQLTPMSPIDHRKSASDGDSFKTIVAVGLMSLLAVCVIVIAALVLRQRRTVTVAEAGSTLNDGNRGEPTDRLAVNVERHKTRRNISSAATSLSQHVEDRGTSGHVTSPNGSISSQSSASRNGHYSEILEDDMQVYAGSTAVVVPTLSRLGRQYEGLDPGVIVELETRQPSVYSELGSAATRGAQ